MERNTAGFIGGMIGGGARLVVDQVMFAIGISNVDTVGTISKLFSQYGMGWFVYIIVTGFVGWLVSRLISKEYVVSYFSSGLILGVVLWGIMNIFFAVSGIATPTWSMGIGSFVVNLFSHLIFGIIIVYTISRAKIEVSE